MPIAAPDPIAHHGTTGEVGRTPPKPPVSKKSDLLKKLIEKIELPHALPSTDVEGTLLEQGMFVVLMRELPESRAKSCLAALRKHYSDYNETRVSQPQEIAQVIAPKGKGLARLSKYLPAARLLKTYLQTIFQETHGLDLEEMRTDPVGVGRTLAGLEFVGTSLSSYLLYLAEDGEMPVLSGSVRVLDRLTLMTRTSSVRKAREAIAGLVGREDRLGAAFALGLVADRWCDSRKPLCWDCALLADCPNGKKVHKEWLVQQERLAKLKEKEDARAAVLAIKDEARAKREAVRDAKAQEVAAKKAAKTREKAKKLAVAKSAVERKKKVAALRKVSEREQAKKKAAELKKAKAAKKKAASKAKKKASAKKAAPKKAPKKAAKAAPKKAAKKSVKKVTKKPAKKATSKKTAKKVTTKATKKATKKVAKKVAKKAPAKKAATKKAARRK